MAEEKSDRIMLPDEVITNKIYLIRGEKVMLDRDLAELYGVETKYLKRQVRRNIWFYCEFSGRLMYYVIIIAGGQRSEAGSRKKIASRIQYLNMHNPV